MDNYATPDGLVKRDNENSVNMKEDLVSEYFQCFI
jgi:hypothetical protein